MYSQATHVLVQDTTMHDIGKFLQEELDECAENLGYLWGPRLISRDHRIHVYSDPRDQCSLNTQKLDNKSLTSIHTVLHK